VSALSYTTSWGLTRRSLRADFRRLYACAVPRTEQEEVRQLLRRRVRTLEELSWEELDAYEDRTEEITTASGKPYRVVSGAFWDMGEWASALEIFAKAYPARGWRRWFPYTEWTRRKEPSAVAERPGERPPRQRHRRESLS
jgi:hypothetical protein